MPKTRKFIDKKKAITFQLVHRSQQDPLIADETAPQRVLLPIQEGREVTLEEQQKYGIYFNDDSNYLQHLKDSKDNHVEWPEHVEKSLKERKVKLQLPAEVFPSKHEDKEGMLSKAAPVSGPQLHLDPDLVAAMDEDFNYSDPENELEDNFIELADGIASDQEFDEEFEVESEYASDEEIGSELSFGQEETKSRFTNYSMTSSVIKRNNQLTLLDDRFEKMYADYDETEIGPLDCEEIEGHVPETANVLLQYAEEFAADQKRQQLETRAVKAKTVQFAESDSEHEKDEMVYVEVPQKEQWDCESILSTYSNLYNHPKLIKEPDTKIKISKRTGIPLNVLGHEKLTQNALDRLNEQNKALSAPSKGPNSVQSVISQLSVLSMRNKHETLEEKKMRKNALKEYRRERRAEKKDNALAFKDEAKRQHKITINNRNNLQGNKIL